MAQEKTILESIQDYLRTCPAVEGHEVYKDYIPEGEGYSVNTYGGEPVYKKYADGTPVKQFWFTVEVKTLDSQNSARTIDGDKSCQLIGEWFDRQSESGSLPVLEHHTPVRIETVKSADLITRETGYTQYQMQCRCIYLEGK